MPVKIRLQRKGRKKKPFYFIVVADSRAPRDGKFIQKIGTYNPLTVPATIDLDRNRALHWLQKGAQPTDTVRRILSFKGVLYLKHLMRGVKLGLFDEKTALEKFDQWQKDHEDKVLKKRETHRAAKEKARQTAQAPVEKPTDDAAAVDKAPEEEAPAEAPATAEAEPSAAKTETPVAEEAKEAAGAEEAPESETADEAQSEAKETAQDAKVEAEKDAEEKKA